MLPGLGHGHISPGTDLCLYLWVEGEPQAVLYNWSVTTAVRAARRAGMTAASRAAAALTSA